MNKTDLLLRMMEHPQRYTADEWQEILADEECRELYTLMSKTQSAVDAARADEEITDKMIDDEWKQLAQTHSSHFTLQPSPITHHLSPITYHLSPITHHLSPITHHLSPLKVAAMFVCILMLSGITYAAIHFIRHIGGDLQSPAQETRILNSHQPALYADSIQTDTIELKPKLYDNVPLEQMLAELSCYYDIKVEYRNDATRQLRLFYQWKPEYTIEKVVEMLNNFDWLQLELKKDSLFVSSTISAQP